MATQQIRAIFKKDLDSSLIDLSLNCNLFFKVRDGIDLPDFANAAALRS
jgi:hypothetical protein